MNIMERAGSLRGEDGGGGRAWAPRRESEHYLLNEESGEIAGDPQDMSGVVAELVVKLLADHFADCLSNDCQAITKITCSLYA